MRSLHYNNGSIKLTQERSTIVSCWEANEVARWISGLAGIEANVSEIFLNNKIDGISLGFLHRNDLQRMGIVKLDQQLILMQSIHQLLNLVESFSSDTLASLFMRIQSAASQLVILLKRTDFQENSNFIKSPEFYSIISHLFDTIVMTCHWLGRLPFIENVEYIDLRRKVIQYLVQIPVSLRNIRAGDKMNVAKPKLILETDQLRTLAQTLIRNSRDSLFSSDRYLSRVHLRRPQKDDVNIEYTTMPDFTHVISSIETESIGLMGSGFSAINIGDEIIEINNQVVIGWDPIHFARLIENSSQTNEICLLVKKMPRHKDDEVYTQISMDGLLHIRKIEAKKIFEQKQKQTHNNRRRLMEQEGEIEIESDDETLYQSKRSSVKKPDQHTSLPDLTDSIGKKSTSFNAQEKSNFDDSNQSDSTALTDSTSVINERKIPNENHRMTSSTNFFFPSPKTQKKAEESHIPTIFRFRPDQKSIIPNQVENNMKDEPKLVTVKRIESTLNRPPSASIFSTSPNEKQTENYFIKSQSQSSLHGPFSPVSSSIKSSESPGNDQTKRKSALSGSEKKIDQDSVSISSQTSISSKPPTSSCESPSAWRSVHQEKRSPSYRRVSCKDLGKGDCEGVLKRFTSKGTITCLFWRSCWCVLKGGILYIFKKKDDKIQEVQLKLEGKNISPAPEKGRYAFRINDETNKTLEYFSCSSRDEMAKWMNKMGLAAINFEIDDSKIAGFNKGFVDSREGSPALTPRILKTPFFSIGKKRRPIIVSSAGDSDNDSDKESNASWQQSISINDQILRLNSSKSNKSSDTPLSLRSASSNSIVSLPETKITVPMTNPTLPKNTLNVNKGHHRTASSPIRLSVKQQTNVYLQSTVRSYDSDSSNEFPCQRSFINSEVLNEDQVRPTPKSYPTLMLNSSGGFVTPTPRLSSNSSDLTESFSPSPKFSAHERRSNNSDLTNDECENLPWASPDDLGSVSSNPITTKNQTKPMYISLQSASSKRSVDFFFPPRSPSTFEQQLSDPIMNRNQQIITSSMQSPNNSINEKDGDESPSSSVF